MLSLNKTNRVRAYVGSGAEQRAERDGHWLKAVSLGKQSPSVAWCINNRIPLEKATSELGNTAGGFLVPNTLDAAIINVRDTVGAFRQRADVRPARADGQTRPRRIGGTTANFVSEGAAIPESSWMLDSVDVALKKLGILVRASTELYEDSESDLAEFVASEFGYALAGVEDDCGFNGDGTSAFRGISGLGLKLTGNKGAITAGNSTYLTLTGTDITDLMAAVLATSIPGACWFISAIGFAQCFCRLAATSGGLVASPNPDGTITASFLGFPVVFSSKLPNVSTSLSAKPMIFFGNLAQSSMIVERNNATIIATSTERALDQDEVLIRGVRREDINIHSVGDATNFGAMAMLVGA